MSSGYGITKVQLRGRNGAATNTAYTLWASGAANYAQMLTGTACEVVSSSASDAAAGTGARTVVVKGLDASYVPFTETVTLNGITPVALTNTSIVAVNRFYVATTGNGLANAGTIDVRTVSGSTVKSRINTDVSVGLGLGEAAEFIYTVPAGYNALLKPVDFGGTTLTGALTVNVRLHDVNGVKRDVGAGKSSLYVTGFNGGVGKINFGDGFLVPEKTLIEGRCYVSAGTSEVVAMADLMVASSSLYPWPFNPF